MREEGRGRAGGKEEEGGRKGKRSRNATEGSKGGKDRDRGMDIEMRNERRTEK